MRKTKKKKHCLDGNINTSLVAKAHDLRLRSFMLLSAFQSYTAREQQQYTPLFYNVH